MQLEESTYLLVMASNLIAIAFFQTFWHVLSRSSLTSLVMFGPIFTDLLLTFGDWVLSSKSEARQTE